MVFIRDLFNLLGCDAIARASKCRAATTEDNLGFQMASHYHCPNYAAVAGTSSLQSGASARLGETRPRSIRARRLRPRIHLAYPSVSDEQSECRVMSFHGRYCCLPQLARGHALADPGCTVGAHKPRELPRVGKNRVKTTRPRSSRPGAEADAGAWM